MKKLYLSSNFREQNGHVFKIQGCMCNLPIKRIIKPIKKIITPVHVQNHNHNLYVSYLSSYFISAYHCL